MTVTAVICSFWAERFNNVERILSDLTKGSVVPDRVVILNNNPDHRDRFMHLQSDTVDVLGGANTECRGKFVAALFRPADFYVLADDDTSFGLLTLECLLRYAGPGFVTGFWGVQLHRGSFMQGAVVFPSHVDVPVKVDAFHGRVVFMAHDALVRMFEAEGRVRLANPGMSYVGDDILAGLANPGSVVIPMRGDEHFVDLDWGGVAMCTRDGYFAERDVFTAAAVSALAP